MDPRARVWKAGADSEETDPRGADHPWAASVCRSRDRQEEPGRQFGHQGPWLRLRGPGESLRPEVPENPSSRLIRLEGLPVGDRSSASACRLVASPS